ncbi:hypothetical protein [Bacillus sp. FJAT-27225]|uniref:hypothetical protein n=1 Tax=Bacillus sp. FJAT-27225 TaxID=1743144 RepID=UPI0020C783BD|nr:hypothetical protein [Bacillus sp. FJAT-27225]
MKRKWKIGAAILLLLCILTNPSTKEYVAFSGNQPKNLELRVKIDRTNFFLFSTYAPKIVATDEYGMVHLGVLGRFYQVSDGQYDYPWWLELLN